MVSSTGLYTEINDGRAEARRMYFICVCLSKLTCEQSTVQVQRLQVRQVAQPLRNPPPQSRVVRQVQVLQTVQVAEALGHLPLHAQARTKGREGGREGESTNQFSIIEDCCRGPKRTTCHAYHTALHLGERVFRCKSTKRQKNGAKSPPLSWALFVTASDVL